MRCGCRGGPGGPGPQRAAAGEDLVEAGPRLLAGEAAAQGAGRGDPAHDVGGEAEPGEEPVGLTGLGRHAGGDLLAAEGLGEAGGPGQQGVGDARATALGHDVELVDGDRRGVDQPGQRLVVSTMNPATVPPTEAT